MRVKIATLGCKANQSDSEMIAESLLKSGFSIEDSDEPVDAIVVNTCAVTNESERKSRQLIRKLRSEHQNAFILVCGCYAQIDPDGAKCDGTADVAIKASQRSEIPKILTEALGTQAGINNEAEAQYIGNRSRISLKVQDGCGEKCAYCIIPKARGKLYSMQIDEVLDNVRKIALNHKEIVLTGIHLTSYSDNGLKLAGLITRICNETGIERVRLGSLDPMAINEEFLSTLHGLEQLCPHFHVSLQSGSDRMLSLMNRKYDTSYYERVCHAIRAYFPLSTITTDIIVGFPSETEQDFYETVDFIGTIGFSSVHIFPFSSRSGTQAASMDGKISNAEKKIRADVLSKAANIAAYKVRSGFIGINESVLVENRNSNNQWEGFTRNYLKACFASASSLKGKIVEVAITGQSENKMLCEIIPSS